jgi:hypothetical protein
MGGATTDIFQRAVLGASRRSNHLRRQQAAGLPLRSAGGVKQPTLGDLLAGDLQPGGNARVESRAISVAMVDETDAAVVLDRGVVQVAALPTVV